MPPDYAARIREVRQRLGLTQARLGELVGVSFASVNRWENAQTRPSALAWQQILAAEELGMKAFAGGPGATAVREAPADYLTELPGPAVIDFSGDPEVVRVVAEAERLSFGHLFNPAFATEISLIEPLPHQRIAVYERMLPQPCLRFLLADDAGAGKTIMTGLYVREMLARRLIRRVLMVVPAGLVGNWERELRRLFSLPVRIASGADARRGNPFAGSDGDLVIVSVDTLAGERVFARLQEPSVEPYDLVVFDEAHKLSADRQPDFTVRRTERYQLAEALAGASDGDARWSLPWTPRHVLLLTATPHMGRDYPYYALWRLLEPEVLSTPDAFHTYPADARQRHFIRRTKEEMVRFDGSAIYPMRITDTLSYDLSQGEVSEQALYDETTAYIRSYYNLAQLLNRSAARLAMSIFQRRLASSTYALLRSFQRRLAKLDGLIADIRSGKLRPDQLHAMQRRLDRRVEDPFEVATADEESGVDGREQNEVVEDDALSGVVAVSLAQLETERTKVQRLLELAERVYERGDESKFEKLREQLQDERFHGEKLIIFTEHRDTLEFLVRRLEGLGFTGHVAQIHGGMDYHQREDQVEFFRRSPAEGGATYLVATDAAGEGINLQFCWLMINYDVPWNPARLEQRMGRIHRYGQQHDPVVILNLVAGRTREGHVIRTLLDKLEQIRRELQSDKVFDVVGRLFEGVSIKQYMEQALDEAGATEAQRRIQGTLTKEQVRAIEERERRLYGEVGGVQAELSGLREAVEREQLRRLLPGYVRRFVEKSAPLIDLGIDGDLEGTFWIKPLRSGALDPVWPALEAYPDDYRNRLTVYKPAPGEKAIFLHPGEPFFDRFRLHVCARFADEASRGAVYVDPYAAHPYLFHLAVVTAVRQPDPMIPGLDHGELVERRLVGLMQEEGGAILECPLERLLLLKGAGGIPAGAGRLAAAAEDSRERARAYALGLAEQIADARRTILFDGLPERERFLIQGYDYQDADLAAARVRLNEKTAQGDARAKGELTRIRERQRSLAQRRAQALPRLRREVELVQPGEVRFLAHALVVPSTDPEERRRHDAEVEGIAMRVAWSYEEAVGASVRDVSKPELAREAQLTDCPGFDLLSHRRDGDRRLIEVKGRAGIGDIELTENEWAAACNHRDRYWLYVVYECASAHPRLIRVQDPFWKLVVRAKGGVIIDEREVLAAAEA